MEKQYTFELFDWSDRGTQVLFKSAIPVAPRPGTFVALNWHEPVEIKYFRSGATAIECNSHIYTATAGDVTIMNSYQPHSFSYISGESVYDALHFSPQFLLCEEALDPSGTLLRPFSEHRVRFRNHIQGDARFSRLFDDLASVEKSGSPVAPLFKHALFLELIAILFSDYVEEISEAGDVAYGIRFGNLVLPAIENIRQHYRDPIRLETLAAACGVAVSYFCPMFKRVTGTSAIAFLNTYRVSQASLLLETTDLSTEEIALRTGFTDVGYFYRCFRAHRGMTPRQARSVKKPLR